MSWTSDEIKATWLREMQVDDATLEALVDRFNVVERYFGRAWMEESRFVDGVETWGAEPAAYLASEGARLRSLDGAPGAEHLLVKLRRRDNAAWAELTAIWLLRSDYPDVGIEVEPQVPGATTVADFRAFRNTAPWTYVEVTQPNRSKERHRVDAIVARLSDLPNTADGAYALEVFLHRAPTAGELEDLADHLPDFCRKSGVHIEELANGLGVLYLNTALPGQVVLDDHGFDYRPRIGRAAYRVESGEAKRHIAVRLAFSDDRADTFLQTEARQLSRAAPGLIMIHTSGATGAFKHWEALISRRFQPKLHTRISAACLFESAMFPTQNGVEWRVQTRTVINPHALHQLPEWIVKHLGRFTPTAERT